MYAQPITTMRTCLTFTNISVMHTPAQIGLAVCVRRVVTKPYR